MSALSPSADRGPVLVDRILSRGLVSDAIFIAAGVGVVALLARVAIPLYPVPVTGQTLGVLLVGASLGAARGAISMAVYALVGALGLPVFAQTDGVTGWHVLMGPTGGYIVGFIMSAALVGWCAQRKWDRKLLKALATFAAGSLAVFAVGLPWLSISLGLDLAQTLEGGLFPFLIGGAIKAAIAGAVLPLAWRAVAHKRSDPKSSDTHD